MIQYLQYMIKFIKLEFSLMIDILNLILFFFKNIFSSKLYNKKH